MLSLFLSSVILVTLDTTRYDALTPQRMPNLHAKAQQGLVLERAYSAATVTIPSHLAMMTGQTPGELGLWGNSPAPAMDPKDVAEDFNAKGFKTHAVVALPVLFERAGLGYSKIEFVKGDTGAEAQTNRALAFLQGAPADFFLWVHYWDPHDYGSRAGARRPQSERGAVGAPELTAAYYKQVAKVDAQLGRLFAALPQDALVFVIGDHGEDIGRGHMGRLTDGVAHVPFVIFGKDVKAGKSDEVVRQYDVYATLCDVFSLGCSTPHGTSLKPLFKDDDKKLAIDWAYQESSRFGFVVRDKATTITVTQKGAEVNGVAKTDLSQKERALVSAGVEKWRKRSPARKPVKEVWEVLKSLGYVQ